MEKVSLECMLREEVGKGKVNTLRKGGFVPATVYGQNESPLSIKLNRSQLIKFMHAHHGGENMVINLVISGNEKNKDYHKEKSVLIKEIQYDPVKDDILHIDFNRVSLTKAIEIKVPIESKGEAQGVKQEGGVLTHILWELEIECLPTMIPEKIEVDITNMNIDDAIYVKDLVIPEGIEVLTDKETIVFTLMPPKKEEVVEEVPEEEVAAEPEVIKEKKGKEEEVEEEKPKKEEASGEK
ncbi:MAG: 50S ribosomal protein L25 [Candidatus Omnitrophica bacterium]|nr:50S ribosomal protein L25 [Candidatus Omnitrophota bacterium]